MGNTLRKFLQNKNTVTILGVIAGVLVLYFFYNYRIKQAIEPVSVPCAKVAIGATEEITADMIDYVKLSSEFLNKNPDIIRSADQLIGKRVTTGTTIPVHGLFNATEVVSADDLPDAAFANIPDGYTIYALRLTSVNQSGNIIYPGNYIDLYIKSTASDGKPVYGNLVSSIKVLDVKDSSGNHAYSGTTSTAAAEWLLFAVEDEMYLLLKKAELQNISILPVQRNASYSANPGETEITNENLKNFILNGTYPLPE